MEAILRPGAAAPATHPGTGAGANSAVISGNSGAPGAAATGRAQGVAPALAAEGAASTAPTARALRRGVGMHHNLQGDVARAQQALDYLARVASQLETLKADLSARMASRGGQPAQARELDARAGQLTDTLAARPEQAGDGVDAQLDFAAAGARQRFRIKGLDIAALQAGGRQTLGFSVGSHGGPQLAASIEPGLSAEEIAARLDRTLAPVQVRAELDQDRELVFTTRESAFAEVKDAIAVTGRGRVDTSAVAPALDPAKWELGNPDALRQGLREVVQALARVRLSQEAATLALSLAMARASQPRIPSAELAMIAEDFSATAASHDYGSLMAITSALSGVSRERVQALLGLG